MFKIKIKKKHLRQVGNVFFSMKNIKNRKIESVREKITTHPMMKFTYVTPSYSLCNTHQKNTSRRKYPKRNALEYYTQQSPGNRI